MNSGALYALFAYTIWGLFPLFWRLLQTMPATQITAHRIIWSWAVLIFAIFATKQWRAFRKAIDRRALGIYSLTAVLISLNWCIYIWGVNTNHVVETSLGYFINPLISVFFGIAFFKERPRPLHWLSLGSAASGVVYLTYHYGRVPWIALALATTFSLYGLMKKIAPLKSLFGLTLETSSILLPAFVYLAWCERNGTLQHGDLKTYSLLIAAGVVTVCPLLLFATAAQRIPLMLIGIMQYIAPTLQILLGIFFFREPFSSQQLIGFSLVWIALAIFMVDGLMRRPISPKI